MRSTSSNQAYQTPRCQVCGKALTDPKSISLEIGPDCLENGSRFLAAAGSTFVEVQILALSDNPIRLKWVRCLLRAIGRGRQGDVQRFLFAARNAA